MSVQSTLDDEMARYSEMLLKRWDREMPQYREDGLNTTKEEVIEATILLFPEATDTQVSEMTSMAHGMCHPDEVEEIREEME